MKKKHALFDYLVLFPLSLLYGAVVAIRNWMFNVGILSSQEFKIPVISVGNITVGGTGKTPHVEYLVSLLRKDFHLAVLSRGYKRKTRGFVKASASTGVLQIGDEPLQIHRKFPGVSVVVDESRVHGINRLLQNDEKLNAVILDDAYQHRYVHAGINILLIDYDRMINHDHLLPFGRLRESAREKRRANIIIITKCPARIKPIEKRLVYKELNLFPYQTLFFTTLQYDEPLPVFGNAAEVPDKKAWKNRKPNVLMLTGIANPRLFKKQIRSITTKITELAYPDHHNYKLKDLQKIISEYEKIPADDKIIITTEKDAMRLQEFEEFSEQLRDILFYIPVRVVFMEDKGENFKKIITNYVRNNKAYSKLHQ